MPEPIRDEQWELVGEFDDGVSVELVVAPSGIVPIGEIHPTDGPDCDQWGDESLFRARLVRLSPNLLKSACSLLKELQAVQVRNPEVFAEFMDAGGPGFSEARLAVLIAVASIEHGGTKPMLQLAAVQSPGRVHRSAKGSQGGTK